MSRRFINDYIDHEADISDAIGTLDDAPPSPPASAAGLRGRGLDQFNRARAERATGAIGVGLARD